MPITKHQHHVGRHVTGLPGGSVRAFRKHARPQKTISNETRRTFEMISAPANAHLFTAKAALQAFAHIISQRGESSWPRSLPMPYANCYKAKGATQTIWPQSSKTGSL